ncbi:MAG: IclR family transcriptional regulator [Spirochaetota bacterium]
MGLDIKNTKKIIQSVKRAGEILSLYIDNKSLGVSDLARSLSLPKTTIQGLVTTLAHMNYLEKDRFTNKYRLGPRLFQLGMSYAANMDMLTAARVWMERLCFKFQEPVNVGMLVGKKALILFRAEPDKDFKTFPQSGTIIPIHTSCIGKILFASMTPEKLEESLKDYKFEPLTKNTITSKAGFLKELDLVRDDWVSFDREENFIGMAGIGAPIFNHSGHIIAAFALTGNADRINEMRESIIKEVKNTSKEISAQLAFR